jgi:hypothetical protein
MAEEERWEYGEERDPYFAETEAADREAADLLRGVCEKTFGAPAPEPAYGAAAAHLRESVETGEWPYGYFVEACGWQDGATPTDDDVLWRQAAAATIRPLHEPKTDIDSRSALAALNHADWFGMIVGLVRRGVGAHFDQAAALTDIASCPEIDDETDDTEADESLFSLATAVLIPLWQGLGILDDDDQVTRLGVWALPRALHDAWSRRPTPE